ncbi:MAG: hypothetical protein PHF58_14060, partial [Methylotenera sp.]|nr:hypothetical protein [Methylotenera sp.]
KIPIIINELPSNNACCECCLCPNNKIAATKINKIAIILYKDFDFIRVAHPAPVQAPIKLPDSKISTTDQWFSKFSKGMTLILNGKALVTTIKLMALLRMIASSAKKPNKLMSSGKRNSAPPSPINPPNIPMSAPIPKTGIEPYFSEMIQISSIYLN